MTTTTSGKRKESVARAHLEEGDGTIRINSKLLDHWQPQMARDKIREPLILAEEVAGDVDIEINVEGGGIMGQAEATRTAIARALVEHTGDEDLKERFIAYDRSLLVNDPRRKEPKHELGPGARAKKQKSYR